MRLLLIILFSFCFFKMNAQVESYFGGTLNVFGSSGSSPEYNLTGFFNDTSGEYPLDSVTVGDILYISEGSTCVRLRIDTINSSAGGILDADVFDVDTILVSPPSGIGALMRETPNSSLPRYIPGLSETLLSCIRTHMTGKIDQDIANAEDGNGIISALPNGDVEINAQNNSFIINETDFVEFYSTDFDSYFYMRDTLIDISSSRKDNSALSSLRLANEYITYRVIEDASSMSVNLDPNGLWLASSSGNIPNGADTLYFFPKSTPSETVGDTTIMAWRGTGSGVEAVGFVPYNSGDGNGIISALPSGPVNIDAATNNLFIDSTGVTRINAENTSSSTMIVSGNSSLPSSFTNIIGTDTAQLLLQGANASLDAVTVTLSDDLSIYNFGPYKIFERTSSGTEVGIKILAAHEDVIDPYGIRITHTPTLRGVAIGDVESEFSQWQIGVSDATQQAWVGGQTFGIDITGSVTNFISIGDHGYNDNGMALTIDDANQVIRFGDIHEDFLGNIFVFDNGLGTIEFGDFQELELGFGFRQTANEMVMGDIYGANLGGLRIKIDGTVGEVRLGDVDNTVTGFNLMIDPQGTTFEVGDIGNDRDGTGIRATGDGVLLGEIFTNQIDRIGYMSQIEDEFAFTVYDSPDSTQFEVTSFGVRQYSVSTNTGDISTYNRASDDLYVSYLNGAVKGEMYLDTAEFYVEFVNPTDTALFSTNSSGGIRLFTTQSVNIEGTGYSYPLATEAPIATDTINKVMVWDEGVASFKIHNGSNYRTLNASGNILPNDDYVELDPSVTAHLPAPSVTFRGKVYHIIAGGGVGVGTPGTIDVVNGSSTIETGTSLTLDNAFESYTLVCNGSQWIVLNNKP